MKIVRIVGGLGNQMFQYAFALALKEKYPKEKIYIDSTVMNGYPLHNGFELTKIFKAKLPQAPLLSLLKVAYPLPHYRLWQFGCHILPKRKSMVLENAGVRFNPNIFSQPGDRLYEGYWQSEKYFNDIREIIVDSFVFPKISTGSLNQLLLDKMDGKTTVGIHVRRGDYVSISNAAAICTLEYYRAAISMLLNKVVPDMYIIFSDDISWCSDNLGDLLGDIPTEFVNWNKGDKSFRDMQLMSMCTHNVIANSSFSWWGAWLNNNPDKIVLAPSKWMVSEGWHDILPETWIKIKI